MQFSRSLSLLALVASFSSSPALHAQTPYLETASLSFLRAFVDTGITSTTSAPIRIAPGAPGPIDPEVLKPGDRVTTDIGTPVYHTQIGDQADWVAHCQRTVLERIAFQKRARLRLLLSDSITLIGELEDEIDALEDAIATTSDDAQRELLQLDLEEATERLALQKAYVAKQSTQLVKSDFTLWNLDALLTYAQEEFNDQGARWELTAVRAPQRTVDSAARTPYKIFLSRIERTRRNPTRTFDSGLRLQPLFAVGASVETLDGDGVTRATGNYTAQFEILLDHDLSPDTEPSSVDFAFAADPLHSVPTETLALAEAGVDYHKNVVRTRTFGSGYMTFALRSTPGPLACVVPTKVRITGHGTWTQHTEKIDVEGDLTYWNPKAGITPFAIKMGASKFQSVSLFPDFQAD